MNHPWTVGSVKDDQLEQVAGATRSEHEVAQWIVADLLDDQRVRDGVLDVGRGDVVAMRRRQNLHTSIS